MDIGSLTGQIAIEDQLTDTLTHAALSVKTFAESFEGMVGTVVVGASAITAALVGAVISIEQLGEKGSKIQGVEDAFNKLAEAAGTTGEALITGLSEGVHQTVGQYELMQASTRLLSSGIKLTGEDMKTLGETARTLAKATGGDVVSSLQQLELSLQTGNQRMLKRIGIMVDTQAAEDKFAKSINTTRESLNQAGKLEAIRIATLEAMRGKLDVLGVSELSFAEKIDVAKASLTTWVDNLAKAVANSPHVSAALDAIGKTLVNVFGGSGQTALEVIVGWVNNFADAVTYYGPIIIQFIGDIRDMILALWHTVVSAWDTVPEWFRNIARDAGLAAGGAFVLNEALKGTTGSDILSGLANVAQIWSVIGKNTLLAVDAMKLYAATLLLTFRLGGIAAVLTGIGEAILGIVSAPLFVLAAAIASVWGAWKLGNTQAVSDFFEYVGLKLRGFGDDAAYAAVQSRHARDEISNLPSRIGAGAGFGKDVNLPNEPGKPKPPSYTNKPDPAAYQAALDKIAGIWEQYNQVVDKMSGDQLAAQLDANDRWEKSTIAAIDRVKKKTGLEQQEIAAVTALHNVKALQIAQDYADKQVAILTKSAEDLANAQAALEDDGIAKTLHAIDRQQAAKQAANQLEYNKGAINEATLQQLDTDAQAKGNADRAATLKAYWKGTAQVTHAGYDALRSMSDQYNQYIVQQTGTKNEVAAQGIDEWERQQFMAYKGDLNHFSDYVMGVIKLGNAKKDALLVDDAAIVAVQQKTLDEAATTAHNTYVKAAADPTITDAMKEHFRELDVTASNTAHHIVGTWEDAFSQIIDGLSGVLQAAFTGGGGIMGALSSFATAGAATISKTLTKTISSALQNGGRGFDLTSAFGGADVINATTGARGGFGLGGASTGASFAAGAGLALGAIPAAIAAKTKTAGALAGAQMGAGIGTMIMPGIGTAIGAGVGALTGVLKGALSHAGRDAVKDFAQSITGSPDLNALNKALQDKFGPGADQYWKLLTQGTGHNNADQAAANIKKVQDAMAALDTAVQKYSLTWRDLTDKQNAGAKSGETIAATFKMLTDAGYSTTSVLNAMTGEITDYIYDAKAAGIQVPASMKPILEQMLALNENQLHSAPTFAALDALAKKYNLTAEQMGSAFATSKLHDTFQILTDDLDAFARGGVDLGNILVTTGSDGTKAMTDLGVSVSAAIDEAMKYGIEVPANLKPAAQALIDQGLLLDDNGKKITDISQIKFGDTLQTTLQILNQTLKDLIKTLVGPNGVAGSLNQTFNRTYNPTVKFSYDTSGQPDYSGGDQPAPGMAGGGVVQPSYYGSGGKVIAFKPRGTDVVPAMLTPGETVEPVGHGNQDMEQTIEVHLDDGVIATAVLKGLPKVAKVRGVNVGMR